MHEVFTLKLPQHLSDKLTDDIKNNRQQVSIIPLENGNYIFKYANLEYKALLYKLPCIIEAHKTKDRKHFIKTNDISNCLFVFDDPVNTSDTTDNKIQNIDVNMSNSSSKPSQFTNSDTLVNPKLDRSKYLEMLEKDKKAALQTNEFTPTILKTLENSGISPGLFLAKLRFFRKKSKKAQELEAKERKVKELLQKERTADKVELIFGKGVDMEEEEKLDSDLMNFAAEIEKEMETPKRNEEVMHLKETLYEKKKELEEICEKISIKENQLKNVTNVIVKKRFNDNLISLKSEYERVDGEIKKIEGEIIVESNK